ncbi:TetR/AcrR family transcriptional regulator [Nocardioides immobilis]|uniref:TetR/AcrR family transcriptional regulator n=1 Tax=Nocardioides immobilis TaxID=2049295 RepID=A0A417Y4U0_9ACTN|nr:TetR/AcrR family transcriptional regulator [Nocardioides immobilis]RHW27561.1 TetR/AcrR family transcriptional regulator [Nocardioides immobilis]
MPDVDAAPAVTATRRPRGRPGYDQDTVLRRAIDLFNRQGYDATSINDLAVDLGVTKSAIYHHFDSKEAILAAALDEALDGLDAAVAAAADATRDERAYDRLRATVEGAVHILVAHLPAVTLLLRVRGNSPLEQSALERRRRIDEQLATVVKQAVDEGDLRGDIDPEVISRLVFGMVNSLVDWYHPDGSIPPEALAAGVAGVLFQGLHR